MKAEYDLSQIQSRKNPYAAQLNQSVILQLNHDVIAYFKAMVEETGVPYQLLCPLALTRHETLSGILSQIPKISIALITSI